MSDCGSVGQAAGVRQADLSQHTGYTRSSISHIEAGRQRAPLPFWQRAESVLGANGALLAAVHELLAAEAALEQAVARVKREQARRQLDAFGVATRQPDEDRAQVLLPIEASPVPAMPAAPDSSPAAATLRWLVAPQAVQLAKAEGNRRVGQADVTRLQTARVRLKGMDDSLGGGVAYPIARDYLRREALPLLDGSYTDRTGRALFSVMAQLILDLGWMAYDTGQHSLARQHMLRALELARSGQHRLFGGRVLVALSHQALHLGRVPLWRPCWYRPASENKPPKSPPVW